jgi:Mg/Co/Ni transporter MgtE
MKLHEDDLVGDIQNSYARLAKYKKVTMYLYVVDENEKLIGVLDIKELLESKETAKIGDIMKKNLEYLKPKSTYKDAAVMFAKYNFRAVAVVDSHKKLLGAVRYKDIIKFKERFLD